MIARLTRALNYYNRLGYSWRLAWALAGTDARYYR
jgi:hypothetical protein